MYANVYVHALGQPCKLRHNLCSSLCKYDEYQRVRHLAVVERQYLFGVKGRERQYNFIGCNN